MKRVKLLSAITLSAALLTGVTYAGQSLNYNDVFVSGDPVYYASHSDGTGQIITASNHKHDIAIGSSYKETVYFKLRRAVAGGKHVKVKFIVIDSSTYAPSTDATVSLKQGGSSVSSCTLTTTTDACELDIQGVNVNSHIVLMPQAAASDSVSFSHLNFFLNVVPAPATPTANISSSNTRANDVYAMATSPTDSDDQRPAYLYVQNLSGYDHVHIVLNQNSSSASAVIDPFSQSTFTFDANIAPGTTSHAFPINIDPKRMGTSSFSIDTSHSYAHTPLGGGKDIPFASIGGHAHVGGIFVGGSIDSQTPTNKLALVTKGYPALDTIHVISATKAQIVSGITNLLNPRTFTAQVYASSGRSYYYLPVDLTQDGTAVTAGSLVRHDLSLNIHSFFETVGLGLDNSGALWVSDSQWMANLLKVTSPSTSSPTITPATSNDDFQGLDGMFSNNYASLIVLTAANQLFHFDGASWTALTYPVNNQLNMSPMPVAVENAGSGMYFIVQGATTETIYHTANAGDLHSGTTTSAILTTATQGQITSMIVNRDDSKLYVGTSAGKVLVYDTAHMSNTPTSIIMPAGITGAFDIDDMMVDYAGNLYFVTGNSKVIRAQYNGSSYDQATDITGAYFTGAKIPAGGIPSLSIVDLTRYF